MSRIDKLIMTENSSPWMSRAGEREMGELLVIEGHWKGQGTFCNGVLLSGYIL